MTTQYEYYNTNDDDFWATYGANWWGQTFTAASAHTITSVKLKMYKNGTPPTLTVGIRNTTSYYPTGADLTSGTFDSTTVAEVVNPGAWYEINLTQYTLASGTLYAIVWRIPSGDASNLLAMRSDSSSPTYSGGQFQRSTDSGVTWNSYNYTTIDGMFEVWGNPITAGQVKTSSVPQKITEFLNTGILCHKNERRVLPSISCSPLI